MYSERLIGPNEQIVLATNPHAMMVAGTILRSAIGFVLALAIAFTLPRVIPPLPPNTPDLVYAILGWLPTALAALAAFWLVATTIASYLTWRSREYVVTDQRLLRTDGILNKRSVSVPLERINNLLVAQSIFGRMWNYGTLTALAGNDYAADVFHYVPGVLDFQRAVLSVRETRQRGDAPSAPTQPHRIVSPYDRGGAAGWGQ